MAASCFVGRGVRVLRRMDSVLSAGSNSDATTAVLSASCGVQVTLVTYRGNGSCRQTYHPDQRPSRSLAETC